MGRGSSERCESKLQFPEGRGGEGEEGGYMYEGHKKNPFCQEGTVYGFLLKLYVQAIIYRLKRKKINHIIFIFDQYKA